MRILVGSLTLLAGLTASISTSFAASQNDPLQVVVSLKDQELKVFRSGKLIAQSNISSGKKGHSTPTGIFSVLQKNRHHRSNIYSNAPMPYMQRLTWSGIALHSSKHVPAYPASHGCIRMPDKFARKLFKMNTRGMHVVIEQAPQSPQRIEHKALFQPTQIWKPNKAYDPWVNATIEENNKGFLTSDQRYPARIFITRRTHKDDLFEVQRLLNKLGHNAGKVDGLMGPDTWKAIKNFQTDNELKNDGLINHILLKALYREANERAPANGRLYVRKHHKTIYSTQIHIAKPELPLGSHLLTVARFDRKKGMADWINLSLEDRMQEKVHLKTGIEVDGSTNRQTIRQALDRIQISKLDHEQVSRFLSAGSSITISDNGLSIETGAKGTDYIVLTKPQTDLGELALNHQ